jgi:hypothetical protein
MTCDNDAEALHGKAGPVPQAQWRSGLMRKTWNLVPLGASVCPNQAQVDGYISVHIFFSGSMILAVCILNCVCFGRSVDIMNCKEGKLFVQKLAVPNRPLLK